MKNSIRAEDFCRHERFRAGRLLEKNESSRFSNCPCGEASSGAWIVTQAWLAKEDQHDLTIKNSRSATITHVVVATFQLEFKKERLNMKHFLRSLFAAAVLAITAVGAAAPVADAPKSSTVLGFGVSHPACGPDGCGSDGVCCIPESH